MIRILGIFLNKGDDNEQDMHGYMGDDESAGPF